MKLTVWTATITVFLANLAALLMLVYSPWWGSLLAALWLALEITGITG